MIVVYILSGVAVMRVTVVIIRNGKTSKRAKVLVRDIVTKGDKPLI
jgi:hypothetical protein